MQKNIYGIVRYNISNGKRTVIRNSCSKDTFKRLAKIAMKRFEDFSYDNNKNSFMAGNLLFKYEWFPDIDFSILN